MDTKETLNKLIQLGLGSINDFNLPKDANWNELIDISLEQGVCAIAFDGFHKLSIEGVVPEMLLMKWFGMANLIKTKWQAQYESAEKLSRKWQSHDIRTLVLKGFAFGRYYPNPSSRPASDLDCYLCGKYEDGNLIAEKLGCEVSRDDYRHSTFTYNNVHVENHKICTTIRGKKQRKVFERHLRDLLENMPTSRIGDSELEQPCLMFNALYFLQHSHRHFLREGITLRYICDWAMILKVIENDKDFNLEKFWNQCSLNDLKSFTESMSRLANYVCGVKTSLLNVDTDLINQDKMLLDDCYKIKENAIEYGDDMKAHIQMVKNMYQQRWKYKYFSEDSFLKDTLVSVWSVFFEKEPNIWN